jgi:hypothetical protein
MTIVKNTHLYSDGIECPWCVQREGYPLLLEMALEFLLRPCHAGFCEAETTLLGVVLLELSGMMWCDLQNS